MVSTTPRRRASSAFAVSPNTPSPRKTKSSSPVKKTKTKTSKHPRSVTPSPGKRKGHVAVVSSTRSDSPGLTSCDVAAVNPTQSWIDLQVSPNELRPSATLTTGQCFHWRATTERDASQQSAWGRHNSTEWIGVLRSVVAADDDDDDEESMVVAIRETPETTLFRPLTPTTVNVQDFLRAYFQLDDTFRLTDLYQDWSLADPRLATIAQCIPGVRILDQDPFECLISFICSSNNNIPRITKMLDSIRQTYGKHLVTIGDVDLYSFPSCNDLRARATDSELRNTCGLGYRSRYVLETIQKLENLGGEAYLHELKERCTDPQWVQTKLCEFCGVGRKVADCVALFSLHQEQAIPVDVHVWNMARRDYDPNGALEQVKSLTPSAYQQVGDLFRDRFENKAGWAHSLLFVAELPSFRPVLPRNLVEEMDKFREGEKLKKQTAKQAKMLKRDSEP